MYFMVNKIQFNSIQLSFAVFNYKYALTCFMMAKERSALADAMGIIMFKLLNRMPNNGKWFSSVVSTKLNHLYTYCATIM